MIETLEGSTLFAKQSGMHPAELRNMVTSPGGTSAAALHELESGRLRTVLSEAVWAAYRRTVELGDQLEASVGPGERRTGGRRRRRRGSTTTATGRPADGAAGPIRSRDLRAPDRDLWADEAASGIGCRDLGRSRRRGLAPAGRRAIGRRRAGLVARRARRAHRRLAGARDRLHRPRDRDRRLAVRRRLRRRQLRHVQRAPPRAVGVDAARRDPAPPGGRPTASPRGRAAALPRDDPRATMAGAGSIRPSTATTSTTSRSSSRGPPSCAGAGAAR